MDSVKLKRYGKYAVIAILALIQYAQTTRFKYALDDSIFITKNSRVQAGLDDIPRLFENARTGQIENETGYRPLLLLTYATEVHFFGLKPAVAHRTNVALYILLCCLILVFLNRLFPEHPLQVFLVTVLFTTHPLHVEVVANIKGRGEMLAMLFGVIYMYLHVVYLRTNKWYLLLLVPLVFIAASLGKENAITFSAVSFALLFFVRADNLRKVYSGLASFASLVLVLLMRLYVYSDQFFSDQITELREKGVYHSDMFLGNPLADVESKLTLMANSLNIVWHSVKMFLVPSPLVHDYSYNHFPVIDWGSPLSYLGLAIVLLTLILTIVAARKQPLIVLGLVWFLITLSIYTSFVRPATDIFAERFVFSPSLGLCMAAVGALSLFKLDAKKLALIVGVWSAGLLFTSTSRAPAWKDTNTLLEADIETLDDCVRANYNYALYRHQRYDNYPNSRRPGDEETILRHYNLALDQSDRLANLYTALGNAYMRFNMPEKAYPVFKEASEKFTNLAKPLTQLGNVHVSQDRYDSAAFYFTKALDVGKINPENYMNLGLSLYHQSLYDSALTVMATGEQYAEERVDYYYKYLPICIKADSLQRAAQVVNRGLELYPDDEKLNLYKLKIEQALGER